jgi:hypothetical protein
VTIDPKNLLNYDQAGQRFACWTRQIRAQLKPVTCLEFYPLTHLRSSKSGTTSAFDRLSDCRSFAFDAF